MMTMNLSESSKLLTAALHESPRDVEKLLNDGENLKVIDGDGNTPLHLAAREGHSAVVEKLLQKGAETTINNKSGLTAKALAKDMMRRYPAKKDRYLKVIELLENPPVYVKEAKSIGITSAQAAPSEGYLGRVEICKYFKGHILHWFGNLSKEADCSVYDIIYGNLLAKSAQELQTAFNKEAGEKAKKEDAVRKKEEAKKKTESKEEEEKAKKEDASRKKEEVKNKTESKEEDANKEKSKKTDKDKKKQKSDQPTVGSTEAPKEESKEWPDIPKEANTGIHLPANNVRCSSPLYPNCFYGC